MLKVRDGRRKTSIRYGERNAAVVAAVFCFRGLFDSSSLLLVGFFWFIPIVLITDVGLVGCYALLLSNPNRENARRIKKLVLYLFVSGLLAFVVGVTL
jgi:hypothetical protein